jgi:hypothetical protein
MRILHISLIIILFPIFITAQIPNNSFEDWTNMGTYVNPNLWSSLNDITASNGIFTCEKGTPGNPGAAYIKITSRTIIGMGIVPGIVVSGLMNTTTLQPISGFPCASRPESLKGNWQFMAYGSDQGYIAVLLTRWNSSLNTRDTVAYAYKPLIGMEMSWRSFTIPLIYINGASPDSAIIVASASNANGSLTADYSYVYLDNLSFYGTVASTEEIKQECSVFIRPNPGKDRVTVQFNETITKPVLIEVFNDIGQKVLSMNTEPFLKSVELNISGLPEGIFTLRFTVPGRSFSGRLIHKN